MSLCYGYYENVAVIEPCPYCFHDVRVTAWDHLIGLAVQCPNCGESSGPSWTAKRLIVIAIGGLFVNALILFLVTRPLRALFLIAVYVASIATLFKMASTFGSEALENTALICVLLGPILLASIEFLWHAAELRVKRPRTSSPPPRPFVGTRAQELIRNELEIAIYHAKGQIELTAKLSYFAAFLNGVLAGLSHRWLDLIISLLVVGLAYTAKTHESRVFAAIQVLLGFALIALRAELSVTIAMTFLGIGMLGQCLWLARLRRLRSRIPLEPAEHLRD